MSQSPSRSIGKVVDGSLKEPGRITIVQGTLGDQLEDGIGSEGVIVVLALLAGWDVKDAGADHLRERVLGNVRITGTIESIGKSSGQVDALIEPADGKQSGIAGEFARGCLDHQWCAEEG